MEHYTAYIGAVCLDKDSKFFKYIESSLTSSQQQNALAFIGTDVEGQMYTAFFDAESLLPFLVTYQTQFITIDSDGGGWIERKPASFTHSEFDVAKCVDKVTGKTLIPELVKNSEDDPLIFAAHYGFLSG